MWRLCERFPNWFNSPDDYSKLDADTQLRLLTYELIRETEEADAISMSALGALTR